MKKDKQTVKEILCPFCGMQETCQTVGRNKKICPIPKLQAVISQQIIMKVKEIINATPDSTPEILYYKKEIKQKLQKIEK